MTYIPYGKQEVTEKDIKEVIEVLNSDFLTQGKKIEEFENNICKIVGSKFSVSVNSATSALHLSCLALGLGKKDLLWTSPISFVASANAAIYCGADVDFVDIDPKTYNMCPKLLEEKLIQSKKIGRLPKIVMPVHLCGQSCEMEKIYALSKKYNFSIIEDASHALGGSYNNHLIGCCKYSDITVFSFHPVKIITTGEGGAAVTNSENLSKKIKLLRSHGITKDKNNFQDKSQGSWFYEQKYLGYNYRLTDIQAALGNSQLKRLHKYITKRHKIAKIYNEELNDLPIQTPFQNSKTYSSYHLYPIKILFKKTHLNRKHIFNHLIKNNIGVNIHYIPIYHQPFYKKLGFVKGYLPNSENYYNSAISLPIFPTLKLSQQTKVIKSLKKAFLN